MDISCICTGKRRQFGKPCIFTDVKETLLMGVDPNPELKETFCHLYTINREIDNSVKMCAHEVNTPVHPTVDRGMYHREGGWPAAVDNTDKDSMDRFKKKVEKDKNFINSVKSLGDFVENFIMENNSIDIYEEYFEDERIEYDAERSVTTISTFKDLDDSSRSVVDLSWQMDSTKFVAIYAVKKTADFSTMPCLDSYVWDVEDNIKPVYVLKPDVSMTVVECSPIDYNLILSGYSSGQVALWDIRTEGHAQQLSPVANSHTESVTGIEWLRTKQGTAFFSASSDGNLISWDSRNLSSSLKTVYLHTGKGDIPNLDQNYSISCTEYDFTVPDKFMVGTHQGVILGFNRKYQRVEDMLGVRYDCQCGPLLALKRNSFYPQLFVACDAWSLKLWTEAVADTPILNLLTREGYFTDFAWSPSRSSTMYATKTTGILEIWDIPAKNKEPLSNIKLDDESLLSVDITQSGNLIICGALSGSIHLLKIPEWLRNTDEAEKDLVKGCIQKSEKLVGGEPRSVRILEQEMELVSLKVVDEEPDEPIDKPEDSVEVLFEMIEIESDTDEN